MKTTRIFGILIIAVLTFLGITSAQVRQRLFSQATTRTAAANPTTVSPQSVASVGKNKPRTQPNFDIRQNVNHSISTIPTRSAASEFAGASANTATRAQRGYQKLLNERPRAVVRWSSVTGTASNIFDYNAPLTQPDSQAAEQIGRRFLATYQDLIQLSESEIAALQVRQRDRTTHNGATHLRFEQQVNGIDIFQGTMSMHLTRAGEVLAAHGELIPNAKALINATRPALTPTQALTLAASFADTQFANIPSAMRETDAAQQHTVFPKFSGVAREVEARLIYFPLTPQSLRLSWELTIWLADTPDVYLMVIDAERGSLLLRHNYTTYENPHGLVYTEESPRPNLPNTSSAPATVAQQDMPFRATPFRGVTIFGTNDPHYDWWAGASQTTLISNNVDAHLDRNPADNIADDPRLTVSDSNFSFTTDLSKAPTEPENQKAAQVNLFYWINRYHDILYSYGFTESAGNFQTNNFTFGGSGNDAVQADVQDGGGTNNANFATPPDGRAGRVQMYLWTNATPQLDGDFDQGVIIHELTHGLSNRLVGNGSGLSGNQSGGMGEGWSDYFGLALLAKESDNVDGRYAVGQYVANNYTRGIRRYPYTTDKTINPLTYANIASNSQVHAVGEIWCSALWEMRALLIKKFGFAEGSRQSIQLVVDGLKLSPNGPSFLDARDAILLADRLNNNGANQCELWQAFAKRGIGINATTLGADDNAPTESFDTPPYCSSTATLRLDKTSYLAGESVTITLGDQNAGSSAQVTVRSSNTGDQETFTLAQETALAGSFKGSIKISSGKAQTGDGILQGTVEASDLITVSYNDAVTATGTTGQISVQAAVTREKIIFEDSVENGNQGWIPTGSWGFTTARAASGTKSWTDSPNGNYGANSSTSLTSRQFDLSNLNEISLQFAHSYTTETAFDFCLVEFSTDDGVSWSRAAVYTGSASMQQAIVPLPGLANQSRARIRFRLLTDPFDHQDGWYVDDIRLTGRSSNANIIKPIEQSVPQITALAPAFGVPAGGTKVTLTGANFTETSDTSITFDGIPATAINVISSTTITATTPAHGAGPVSVRIKNRYGEASLGNAFTYYQAGSAATAPLIAQVFPALGSTRGGAPVLISGANFTPETTVKFGANNAVVTYINPNTLRVLSPVAGAVGIVDVSATNATQTATIANAFTYIAPTPPTVQVTSPQSNQAAFAGGLLAIQWNSSDNRTIAKHRIALFRDTTFVSDIATEVAGEAQTHYWRIPTSQTSANNYRVRVVAIDDEAAESEAFSGTFSIAKNWTPQAALPSGLMRVAYVGTNDGIIAIGGRTGAASSTGTNTVRQFNPATTTWTSLNGLPVNLSSTDAAFIDGKIFVPGGVTETSATSTHYVYDISANSWSTAANVPAAISAHAVARDTGKAAFYLTGGLNNLTVAVSTVRAYDVATNAWSTLPALKNARYAHEAAFVDGKLYVAGGFGVAGGLTSCEVFDFTTQQWTELAPLSTPRGFAAATVYRDNAGNPYWLLVGGENSSTRALNGTAEVYDFRNNRWVQLDGSFNLNTPRTQTNGAVTGNTFYVIGGGTGSGTQPTASSISEAIKLPLNLDGAGVPPSLAVPPQVLALAGTEVTFEVTANSINTATTLNITASGLPTGAAFNPLLSNATSARGTFRWNPRAEDVGKTFQLTFQAVDGGLQDVKNVTITVVAATAAATVNAANYRQAPLPPDSIASVFGADLAVRVEAAPAIPVPNELAGTRVFVNGVAAPLLYVSPSQINFVVPATIPAGTATIIVSNPTGKYAMSTVQIAPAAPSLFTLNAEGTGAASALATSDGIQYLPAPFERSINGKPNFLILFGTGFRRAEAQNPTDENGVAEAVRVTIDGIEARVDYAGAQGFFVGLDQINVLIPETIAPGARNVEVVVTVNGIEANRVMIALK